MKIYEEPEEFNKSDPGIGDSDSTSGSGAPFFYELPDEDYENSAVWVVDGKDMAKELDVETKALVISLSTGLEYLSINELYELWKDYNLQDDPELMRAVNKLWYKAWVERREEKRGGSH